MIFYLYGNIFIIFIIIKVVSDEKIAWSWILKIEKILSTQKIPKKNFSFTVEEIDIILRFSKRNIQFFSGTSLEYQFEHQYEINRIDRLQIGGDLDYIEEVALRYKKSF